MVAFFGGSLNVHEGAGACLFQLTRSRSQPAYLSASLSARRSRARLKSSSATASQASDSLVSVGNSNTSVASKAFFISTGAPFGSSGPARGTLAGGAALVTAASGAGGCRSDAGHRNVTAIPRTATAKVTLHTKSIRAVRLQAEFSHSGTDLTVPDSSACA